MRIKRIGFGEQPNPYGVLEAAQSFFLGAVFGRFRFDAVCFRFFGILKFLFPSESGKFELSSFGQGARADTGMHLEDGLRVMTKNQAKMRKCYEGLTIGCVGVMRVWL